jgi:transposase-like protein
MNRVETVLSLIASWSESERAVLRERLGPLSNPPALETPPPEITVSAAKEKPSCPKCGSVVGKGHGKYRGRCRYKCLSCSRRFNDLTGTPLAGIHLPEKMRDFTASMATGGDSLRKSAKEFDIGLRTAFNWHHKVPRGYSVAQSRTLKGIIVKRVSWKGLRQAVCGISPNYH